MRFQQLSFLKFGNRKHMCLDLVPLEMSFQNIRDVEELVMVLNVILSSGLPACIRKFLRWHGSDDEESQQRCVFGTASKLSALPLLSCFPVVV